MSKVIAEAAAIVGTIAKIASFIPGPWQAPALIISEVATVVAVAAAAASYLTPKPNQVQPMEWKADPTAGIPYAMGQQFRTASIAFAGSGS